MRVATVVIAAVYAWLSVLGALPEDSVVVKAKGYRPAVVVLIALVAHCIA